MKKGWLPKNRTKVRVLITALMLLTASAHAAPNMLINEQFASLEQWEPFTFPKIDNHSSYAVTTEDGIPCLIATTRNSASAILYKKPFNVYDYPEIAWRWKVSNIYKKGDSSRKDGDDYPVRLYILFQYDPKTASLGKTLRYGVAKLLYGSYPPDSSLNYIWANKKQSAQYIPNPYTSRAMMFPVDQGNKNVGTWSEHTRNIVRDYAAAFGEDPPPLATLAVMSDSDNTGESATAYIEYIRIFRMP
ncbi:MAG: DUF3047 domain-containing protein [Desulfobulbaceae bacterium]|nr:DUF3047 domain-containing protein [Desulfobulbaceae bacterium]